ncbi:MAG: hypothetical protein U0R19_26935 [Bryobacteraceae bacterium]
MRTTIDIDDELLRTAKLLASNRNQTLSQVICDLAWSGLRPSARSYNTRSGFPVLKRMRGSAAVTPDHVNQLLNALDLDGHNE